MAVSIKDIKKNYLEKIKRMAINKGKSEKDILNNIIKDGLEVNKNKELKKERIYNEMVNKDTYNPNNNKEGFKSLRGFMTAPKDFDPVKIVEEANLERFDDI